MENTLWVLVVIAGTGIVAVLAAFAALKAAGQLLAELRRVNERLHHASTTLEDGRKELETQRIWIERLARDVDVLRRIVEETTGVNADRIKEAEMRKVEQRTREQEVRFSNFGQLDPEL